PIALFVRCANAEWQMPNWVERSPTSMDSCERGKQMLRNRISIPAADATVAALSAAVNAAVHDLATYDDFTPLLDHIGDARYVLLGEASHGTSEFYTWRARISQRLIREKGFSFIAVEGDWPDCYTVNRYVKHYPE